MARVVDLPGMYPEPSPTKQYDSPDDVHPNYRDSPNYDYADDVSSRLGKVKAGSDGSWKTDESNGVRAERTDREDEAKQERSYTRKHERIRMTVHEKNREKERERQPERARQPVNRVVVQNRVGFGRRQPEGGIDFSQGFISSGLGGAEGYSSPFRGMGMGQSMFPSLSVGRMGLGLGNSGKYSDPFAGQSPLNMRGGAFDRGSGFNLLTEGIFSGKMPSLFGSQAPARRKAPAKKKEAGKRGTPVVYGNAAARGGSVVIQKGKKTHKVPVKRLPPRKKR